MSRFAAIKGDGEDASPNRGRWAEGRADPDHTECETLRAELARREQIESHREAALYELQKPARLPNENRNAVLRLGADGTVLYSNSTSDHLLRECGSVPDADRAPGQAPDSWHAGVRLVCTPGEGGKANRVELCVEEDGIGVDPEHVPGDQFGLSIMAESAASVGAALTIASRPGEGTRVRAMWEAIGGARWYPHSLLPALHILPRRCRDGVPGSK